MLLPVPSGLFFGVFCCGILYVCTHFFLEYCLGVELLGYGIAISFLRNGAFRNIFGWLVVY